MAYFQPMLVTLAALVSTMTNAFVPIQDSERLRTLLPNGAVVLAERVEKMESISVHLVVPSRGTEETVSNHGARHLLEHFLARGPRRDLDRRLEAKGGLLLARTLRDATVFQVEVNRGDWPLALQAVQEALQLGEVTPEALERERKILNEESALREPTSLLSSEIWTAAFGDDGLDPSGSETGFARVTPESLRALHRKLLQAKGVTLLVRGEINVDQVTAAGRKFLSTLTPSASDFRRREAQPPTKIKSNYGTARGTVVSGLQNPSTLATLAAGLALASELEEAFFTYTPSTRSGCALIGQVFPTDAFAEVVDQTDPASLFARGRTLLKEWLRTQLGDSADGGTNRAILLSQSPGLRLDQLLQEADLISVAAFMKGCEAFRTGNAIEVGP